MLLVKLEWPFWLGHSYFAPRWTPQNQTIVNGMRRVALIHPPTIWDAIMTKKKASLRGQSGANAGLAPAQHLFTETCRDLWNAAIRLCIFIVPRHVWSSQITVREKYPLKRTRRPLHISSTHCVHCFGLVNVKGVVFAFCCRQITYTLNIKSLKLKYFVFKCLSIWY